MIREHRGHSLPRHDAPTMRSVHLRRSKQSTDEATNPSLLSLAAETGSFVIRDYVDRPYLNGL